jgi:hypothetical protein
MIVHFCSRRCGHEQQFRVYKVSCYWRGLFVVFIYVVGFLWPLYCCLMLMEHCLFICQIFVCGMCKVNVYFLCNFVVNGGRKWYNGDWLCGL